MSRLFTGSDHAKLYAKFRLLPPEALIQDIVSFLAVKVKPPFKNAVDIGCGAGQSTVVLAPHFQNVTGLDPSASQVESAAEKHGAKNVNYRVSGAEKLEFEDLSVDLVTCSQSFHYFDASKALKEIERILVPNGVLAIYSYWVPFPKLEDSSKTQELKKVVLYLYHDVVEKYSHPGRRMVENQYADLNLPFKDCTRKNYVRELDVTVSEYTGYLSTWSGYQAMLKAEPEKATAVLVDIQKRIMKILEVTTSPEETPLHLYADFFLIMSRK